MKSGSPWRLIVCEPDPQGRDTIREYLRGSPITVCFASPTDPLQDVLSKHSPFNAVIIDLSRPASATCNDLVAAVKQAAPGAEVIFLSRMADEALWSQVLSLGAYDLLPQPPERQEFLRTVFAAVQHTRAAA